MTEYKKEALPIEEEFSEAELEDLKNSLFTHLENELSDLEILEEERKQIADPDSLGKTIREQIWTELGNQTGLELTSNTLLDDYQLTGKGKAEQARKEAAQAEFKQGKSKAKTEKAAIYQKEADYVRSEKSYIDKGKEAKRQQAEGKLKDTYTGKKFKKQDKVDVEHINPIKPEFEDVRRKQAGMDTADIANLKENLTPTNRNLNRSKKDTPMKDFLDPVKMSQRKKDWQNNYNRELEKINNSNDSPTIKQQKIKKAQETLDNKQSLDEKRMREAEKKASKAQKQTKNANIRKNATKKAVSNALKAMSISAMHQLMTEIVQGLVNFFKGSAKSMKGFFEQMKEAIGRFFKKIMSTLKSGATNAIGTIVTEILMPIVRKVKKVTSLIKQSVRTLMEIIRTWRKNDDKPLAVKIAEVGKVLTVGLSAAGGISLITTFKKALLIVPGFQLAIPGLGTLANLVALFLSSLVVGLIGALVMHFINQFIGRKLEEVKQIKQIEQYNEVLALQDQALLLTDQLEDKKRQSSLGRISENHQAAQKEAEKSLKNIFDTVENKSKKQSQVSQTLDKMNEDLKELL